MRKEKALGRDLFCDQWRAVWRCGMGSLLAFVLALSVVPVAWAGGIAINDEEDAIFKDGELEANLSSSADGAGGVPNEVQGEHAKLSDSIDEAFAVEEGVAATPGWNLLGTCEWRIDETGCFTLRPAQDGSVGDLPPLYLDEDAHVTSVPWLNPDGYFWDNDVAKSMKSAVVEGAIMAHESLDALFFCCTELRSITGLERIDLSDCRSLSCTFYMCGVQDLDLSGWNTAHITDMSCLFYRCFARSIDVSGWDTSQVVDMSSMFYQCQGAMACGVEAFDTSNVTDMGCMFFGCGAASLDLSQFNTSNVTNMISMFADNSSLVALDMSGWDTSKVVNADGLFAYTSLSEVKIGAAFTLQSLLPAGVWQNEKGETFTPFDIPRGVADSYARIRLYKESGSMAISDSEKEVVVGCEPFRLDAYSLITGASASEWTSSDPRVATVDASGVVTVHEKGFVDIVASSGRAHATCALVVQSFWIPATNDSDIKGHLVTNRSVTAQRLAGCSIRIMENDRAENAEWVRELQHLLGADRRLVDVVDIDVVDADGMVIPFNDPDNGVTIIMEDGYYAAFKSDDIKMEFHYLDSSGVAETFVGDWFRDCEELMFDTTHLSTYAITATGAQGDDVSVSGVSDLAQTGDGSFVPVMLLIGISILSLELVISCSAIFRRRGI